MYTFDKITVKADCKPFCDVSLPDLWGDPYIFVSRIIVVVIFCSSSFSNMILLAIIYHIIISIIRGEIYMQYAMPFIAQLLLSFWGQIWGALALIYLIGHSSNPEGGCAHQKIFTSTAHRVQDKNTLYILLGR